MTTSRHHPCRPPVTVGCSHRPYRAVLLGALVLCLNGMVARADDSTMVSASATAAPPPTKNTTESLPFSDRATLRHMPAFPPLSPSLAITTNPAPTVPPATPPHRKTDPILATGFPPPSSSLDGDFAPGQDELALQVTDRWTMTLPVRRQAAVEDFAWSLPDPDSVSGDDNLMHQAGELLFPEPASVQLGKTEIGGGIVTAIRRRNPFGLLNPFHIFSISW